MMDFIKGALTEESKETLIQQEYVKQSQRFHGARSYQFISDYYEERQKKQAYIEENIYAQGYDTEEFLKLVAKEKGLGPNIDFFSFQEVEKLVQKFKESGSNENDNFEEGRGAPGSQTMSNFFEQNMRNSELGSFVKKMTRRPTKKMEESILNRNRNIVCIVQNGNQIIQQKFMSYIQSSTVQVDIVTYPYKWKVRRSHADFAALRDYLMRKFPQTIVPPLPRFNPKKKLTPKQIIKKSIYYQRFLKAVLKSMILRSAPFLLEFLREADQDQFVVKAIGASMDNGPKRLNEIVTMGGEIEVTARKSAKAFCDQFDDYINAYTEINNYISEKCKVIQCKAHELADEFFGVAAEVQRFSALLKATEVPQIHLLYERLSQLVLRNGDFILQSGEVINTQLNSWFKYHREESTALREAQNLRDEAKTKYDARYEQLMKQKEKLFKKQDVLAWRVNKEDQIEAERYKTDPALAYQYILPDTTKEVEQLKEEAEYFTNQCYREVKRNAMIDYDMARENFVNMGEMMLRLIYQMNIGWQEFLSFYTGLNVVRKQYDEKFQQEKGIGEEQDDPNASSDDEYNQAINEQTLPPQRSRMSYAYKQLDIREQEEREGLINTQPKPQQQVQNPPANMTVKSPLKKVEDEENIKVEVKKEQPIPSNNDIQIIEEERKEVDV